jgi:hypothetical protein
MRIRRLHIHADLDGCGGPGACDDEGVDIELGHSMTVLMGLRGEARAAVAQLIDLAALEAGPTPHLAGGLAPGTCLVTADDLRAGPDTTAFRPLRAERERLLTERAQLELNAAEYAHQIGTLTAERRAAGNPLAGAHELLLMWRATAERTAARRLMVSSLLASWPQTADRPTGPDPQVVALAQLRATRAQHKVERLRETAHRFALAAGDRSGLEAIHSNLEAAERALQKRRRASSETRVARLRTQERALLDQLGFASWIEYRLATRAAPDEVFHEQIRQAEADAEESRAELTSLLGATGHRDPALEPLRRRARAVLGNESTDLDDDGLVDGLRDILTDTRDVDTARLALEAALDATGAPDAADPAVRYEALVADTAKVELPWRSPEAEEALARDEERLTLEAALAETREQIAIVDAHMALAARRSFASSGTPDEDLELAVLRQASVLRRDGYPLVVDDAFSGRPESLVRTVLSTLEDLAREIQVIVLTEEPAVESWGRSAARTRVALVEMGWDADVEVIPERVQVVVDTNVEVDLVSATHADAHRSGRERCRRCWAIEELEPCAECRRKTCAACLVGPTRFHGRLCVDCALVAAGVRARKVRR